MLNLDHFFAEMTSVLSAMGREDYRVLVKKLYSKLPEDLILEDVIVHSRLKECFCPIIIFIKIVRLRSLFLNRNILLI